MGSNPSHSAGKKHAMESYSINLDIGEAAWHIMHVESLTLYWKLDFDADDVLASKIPIIVSSEDDPSLINFFLMTKEQRRQLFKKSDQLQ